jgi:hypothetical protein
MKFNNQRLSQIDIRSFFKDLGTKKPVKEICRMYNIYPRQYYHLKRVVEADFNRNPSFYVSDIVDNAVVESSLKTLDVVSDEDITQAIKVFIIKSLNDNFLDERVKGQVLIELLKLGVRQ